MIECIPDIPLARFDTVSWDRDGGRYSGMIYSIRNGFAQILSTSGTPTVRCKDLKMVFPAWRWDKEALVNHIRVMYGVELPLTD